MSLSVVKKNKEEELVAHLLSGDARRFGDVYDYFSSDLFGVISKIVQDEKIAEDLLQDTFLKIWNAARSYNPSKSRLFTWMLNIARNSAIDYLRSKQGKIDKKLQPVDSYSQAEAPHFAVELNETGLNQIVSSLKTEQLEIITLGFYEGYTQAEIAVKLNIPLGTVKTRCRAALNTLRQKYIR